MRFAVWDRKSEVKFCEIASGAALFPRRSLSPLGAFLRYAYGKTIGEIAAHKTIDQSSLRTFGAKYRKTPEIEPKDRKKEKDKPGTIWPNPWKIEDNS